MLNQGEVLAAIERRTRGGTGFAVLAVCVCDLRDVGIRYGMRHGAEAEVEAERLIRESLRPVDEVFRAGDECFAVILPDLPARNHALLATTRLFKAFEQPLKGNGVPWQGRLRIGATFFPHDGENADALWRRAQMALQSAARRGQSYSFYDARDNRFDIDYGELREAIETNQLLTYFQTVWNLRTRHISGVESLARWTSPTQGAVPPDQFVTFAEQSDLIVALTHWSINATLREAASLGDAGLSFAINLSASAFAQGALVEQLSDALSIWGVPATAIIAEITETALVNDLDLTARTLRQLRDLGMRVAIDDFGTGYAAITYLSRFPATELKIDRTLVDPIARDPHAARLADSIIQLAHRLDMTTTAEGIADAETARLLTEMGCDYGQGYHLGMPQPAAEFAEHHPTSGHADDQRVGDTLMFSPGPACR
ncbi:MAG TPA: bifunctional diguanylate cyclase/phosphodiesterase [Rhodanobacteraceae bacterium]